MAVTTLLSNSMSIQAERARRSFSLFAKEAWHVIEPGAPYVGGWHLDALAYHLEAVARGDIHKLLINMPPRHGKSTYIDVLWSAWLLLNKPSTRLLCASYALNLATRDNLKARRLIQSNWFQARYGHVFKMVKDQNAKMKFETDQLGYRMAVSVGSAATGEGGDVLLCLCYNTEVTTDRGRLSIGDVVERQLPVQVLAYDHKTNTERWQVIEKYEKNLGRACVRVTLNDGRFVDATADHPFYVVGRGYIPAAHLTSMDRVITDESFLRDLRERVQSQTSRDSILHASLLQCGVPQDNDYGSLRNMRQRGSVLSTQNDTRKAHLLQQRVPLCQDKQNCYSFQSEQSREVPMRSLRQRIREINQPCRKSNKSIGMQPRMSRQMANRAKQSCISRWASRTHLQELWKDIFCPSKRTDAAYGRPLLQPMQGTIPQRSSIINVSKPVRQLCLLWGEDSDHTTKSREAQYVFSQMRQPSAQRTYQGRAQWALCGWESLMVSLPERVLRTISAGQRTRQSSMLPVWKESRREREGIRRSSYRLRQRAQRDAKLRVSLPLVSWENAWHARTKRPVDTVLVELVESIESPEYVYNIRVAEDHNYYANGILVHNCDDPHAIDEKESPVQREAAIDWFDNTWCTRLNDPRESVMVVVGQRIHEQDVSGHILETNDGGEWIHLNLPAEFESASPCRTFLPGKPEQPFWQDPRTEDGQLLWEPRFPRDVIEKAKRRHGPLGYSALYGQNPVPATGGTFSRANERLCIQSLDQYFLHTPRGIRAVKKEDCEHFLAIDPAISEKQSADYMVIGLLAQTPIKDLLLLDVRRDRWDHHQQQEEIEDAFNEHNADFAAVETVAYQHALFQDLVMRGIPCRPFTPHKDKVARAVPASIWQGNGKIYFLKDASWLPELQKELYKFPKAAHDDQVDMLSLASIVVRSRGPLSDDVTDEDIPDPIEGPIDDLIPFTVPFLPKRDGDDGGSTPPVVPALVAAMATKPVDAFDWIERHGGW